MGVDAQRKAKKGVVEEGGALTIAMILIILVIAIFLMIIMRLTGK